MEGAQGRSPHTVTFRYRRENSEILGVIERPVAKVYFGNKGNGWLPCYMYIDSGADFTLVPYKFGLMLGFEMEKTISEVYGVGGDHEICIHKDKRYSAQGSGRLVSA